MTDELKNQSKDPIQPEEPKAVEMPEEAFEDEELTFFEKEMKAYRKFLLQNWDAAYNKYGMILFHCLSPEEKVKLSESLGFEPVNAIDYYNKGVLAIEKNELPKALECFKKALELEPEHPETLFNYALLLEKMDKGIQQALNYWEKYLEVIDDEDEIRAVTEHLEQSVM